MAIPRSYAVKSDNDANDMCPSSNDHQKQALKLRKLYLPNELQLNLPCQSFLSRLLVESGNGRSSLKRKSHNEKLDRRQNQTDKTAAHYIILHRDYLKWPNVEKYTKPLYTV